MNDDDKSGAADSAALEDDEYASAFAELSAKKDEKASDHEPPSDPPDEEDGRDDGKEDAGDDKDDAGDDAPPPEKGAGEVDWSKAPPEFKAAYEKEMAEKSTMEKRLKGQLSGQSRRIRELESSSRPAAPQPAADEDEGGDDDDEELKRLREDYPDLASPILDRIEVLQKQNAELLRTEEGRREAVEEAKNQELLADHPDFYDYIGKNRDEFDAWLAEDDTPVGFIRIVNANYEGITDPAGAAKVFSAFKAYRGDATDPPQTSKDQGKTSSEEARRARQRRGAGAPPPRGPGSSTAGADPDSEDFEAHFKELSKKKDRERGFR
mgnify:CR=1 FL=1